MIIGENDKKIKIGLALSGGGYRAAAFHLGVFRKLKKLSLLDKVDVISTISGGSIAGAYYVLNKDNFELFECTFKKMLQESCVKRIIFHWRFLTPLIILFCLIYLLLSDPFDLRLSKWINQMILAITLLLPVFFQFKIFPFTLLKIKAYKKIFFGNMTMSDLPETPVLAINATNLSTGTLWTFSKNKSSDSSYEFPKDGGNSIKFDCSKMPLAIAVASSTSVPVPFDPVIIPIKYYQDIKDFKRIKPLLLDGGLYDNQGIHKITQHNSSYRCEIIIVSDGSQPFTNLFKHCNTLFILYRGIDVMMRKIKNLQFIRDVYSSKREIAYFSLDWKYVRCIIEFINAAKSGLVPQEVLMHHEVDIEMLKQPFAKLTSHLHEKLNFSEIIKNGLTDKEIQKISSIKTNLSGLKDSEIDLLSRHGEVLTELQIKLYCPTLKQLNV